MCAAPAPTREITLTIDNRLECMRQEVVEDTLAHGITPTAPNQSEYVKAIQPLAYFYPRWMVLFRPVRGANA